MNRSTISRLSFLLLCWASTALAQPAPPAPPATPDDPGAQAYQRGRQHYDLQEWDAAITEFKEAYRLRQDAASLFNIAQSYRLKGDCVQAAGFYKTYRRNFPTEKNIDRVDQFITEMDDCAKKQPATTPPDTTTGPVTPPTSPTTPLPTPAPSAPSPMATSSSGGSLSIAGVSVAGAGVACIAAGVLFGLHARSIQDDVEKAPIWDPDLDKSGKRADLAAKLLLAAGSVGVIAGGTLIVLGYRHHEESAPRVSITPSAHGASVWWSGSF